ncbi:MAG: ATP-binding protein [Jiangellaceae bacterium]
MELLEREPLLAALAARLAEAAAGHGSVALLAGEAGIGKTSLARAFCDRHDSRAQVLWGACDALSTPRPLGPLQDIARAVGGEFAGLMVSEATRYERLAGFLDVLVSPLRPVIAVIEDVHWADDATRDLLVFVARRVVDTNAVVLMTYRDDEIGREHPLRTVLGHLATLGSVHRLHLARLTEQAVATLAAGRAASSDEVYRVTGGNPFFATEVLAAGATATVPETVRDAVLARASRLSASATAVLEVAAVVPDRAEIAVVLAVSGCDAMALDECEQAGVLQSGTRHVRFRHELARRALEEAIPAARVADLHTRVLTCLAAQSGAELARLAYHAEQAGDPGAVLTYAPAAAAQASRLGAHREAVTHLEQALHHADTHPARERAELLERYADECTAIDSEANAIAAAGEALAIWRQLGEVERAATTLARRAYLLWGSGRNKDARKSVREAVTLLEQRPPGLPLATAYTYAAHLHMLAREIPEAIEVGGRAVAMAGEFGDIQLQARVLNIVGAAQWFVDPSLAELTLARALEVARSSGDDTIVGIVMRMLGSGAGEVRRYQTADNWLREGVRWCVKHDLDIHGDYCLAWSARAAFEQGRWSEASSAASRVAGQQTEHAPTRIVALTSLGRLRVRRGDPDSDAPLEEAWELATRTGDLQRLWPAAAGRAEAAWLVGHLDRIPAMVEDTYQLAVRLNQQWPIGELAFWLWRAGVLEEAPANAAEPYAAHINGDWRRAARTWEQIGCPYEVAFARADSDQPAALRAALEIFGQLSARPMANRVAGRLREFGVRDLPRRPHRATVDNPGGLTDRQLEVLGLLTDGSSNAEIAARLHISVKTVGHHVSAVLAKLDVRSRGEAADVARAWGAPAKK